MVQTIWPPIPKEIKDYIAKIGNEEVARNTLETFYSHSNVIHDIHYSPEMIYANRNGKVVLIETKDILWIYPHSFRWSFNFIPIMFLYSVKIYLQDKKLISISVGSQKAANEVIWTFNQFMPYVYYGYRDEIKHLFYQDFKKMLDAKEDCRNRFHDAKRQEEIEREAMIEKESNKQFIEETEGTVTMNTALFCLWIIYELICFFVFWYLHKKEIVRENGDKSFEASCETCNNRRTVTYGEINVPFKMKKQNATADEIIGDVSRVGNGEIVQYSKSVIARDVIKLHGTR